MGTEGTCVISCIFGGKFIAVYPAPKAYKACFFTNNPVIKSEVEKKGWRYVFIDQPISEDAAVSSLQSKYIKFLQFLKEPRFIDFLEYRNILYVDHKRELKDYHIELLLAQQTKYVLLKEHEAHWKNIWQEVGSAMGQERYARYACQTIDYVRNKILQGYSDSVVVCNTGIILYQPQAEEVKNLVDEIYRDLMSVGTSECQIIWAMVSQKYSDAIQVIECDNVPVKWETPILDNIKRKIIIKNYIKKVIMYVIPWGILALKMYSIIKKSRRSSSRHGT